MPRILVISPWESRWSLGSGAGVSDDYNFIKKLTQDGFELHFLAPRSDSPSSLPFDHSYTHSYPNFFKPTARWPTSLRRILWPTLFNIIVTARALAVARRVKPDFILGHSHYSALPSYVAREFFRVPSGVKLFGVMDLVHTEWSSWKYHYKNIEQILALKVPQDVWIILDDGTKGDDAAIRHGVPKSKVKFLPNGINLEWMNGDYDRDAIRAEFGVSRDARVVLFLARLVTSKRPELLIQAIPEVAKHTDRALVFLIVGDGHERENCERLVRSLGVENYARLIGTVPHDRVPSIMSMSDVFVSTSNLTNAAIPTCEALVCGLPVVALDVGNTREVIRDGETGLVVPDGDIAGLAAAIARVIDDDALRARMAENARAYAKEHFTSWDDRTGMEVEIIGKTIAEAGL